MRVLLLPVWNERGTVLATLDAAASEVDRMIVLDDGSTDGSAELVQGWMGRAEVPMDLLRHARNQGLASAILTMLAYLLRLQRDGVLLASDQVAIMDADGQHRAQDFAKLDEYLRCGAYDVVVGARDLRMYPPYKRVGNRLLSAWASLLSGQRYADAECGLRLFRVAAVSALLTYCAGFRYSIAQEMCVVLPPLGYRVRGDVPVSIAHYRQGARFRDGFANLTFGLWAAVRVRLRWGYDPLRRAEAMLSVVSVVRSSGGRQGAATASPIDGVQVGSGTPREAAVMLVDRERRGASPYL